MVLEKTTELELAAGSLFTKFKPAEIDMSGFDETKKALESRLTAYDYQVTTENRKQAVKDKNTLSRASKAINERRKNIKKEASKSIKDFEEQIKVLTSDIDNAYSSLKNQLDDLDEQEKIARHKENLVTITKLCDEAQVDPKKIEYDLRWDNKTWSKTALKNAVLAQIKILQERTQLINQAIGVVKDKADKLGLPAEHWIKELERSELADVLNAMEAYKKELTNIAASQRATKIAQAKALKQRGDVYIDAETGEIKDKVNSIELKVTGTNWQLQQLQRFLVDNGIKYEGL